MMKFIALILTLLLAVSANAQQQLRPEMQEQLLKQLHTMDPQKLQEQLGEMQNCVQKYSSELKAVEAKGKKIADEIDQLCKAGERARAQAYAKSQGVRFMNDPAIKNVQKCSKALANKLEVSSKLKPMPNQHICDQ